MTNAEITALEEKLSAMTEQEVARALNEAELGSFESDVIAGEMERRNIDT